MMIRFPAFSGRGRPLHISQVQTVRVGDPSQTAGCDSRDAERNSVVLAQFLLAIEE